MSEGTRITRKGFALLHKAIAGAQLKFTRACFGDSEVDGQLILPTIEEQFEFNDVINWRMDLPLTKVSANGDGTATISFNVKNAEISTGFWARELAVFAEDPDSGDELLYCYLNKGDLGEFIPASGGAVLYDMVLSVITVIQQATNITAVIDGNLAYVSQSEFTQHINSTNPHPGIPTVGRNVETTSAFWATDEDNNLHKLSAADAAILILGGNAADIPKMNMRLAQTETNIANLFMQLNAEKELGLTANLLMIEDFQNGGECCDLYECQVTSIFAASDRIDLASDRGILAGCWYTITDGMRQEQVQVRSVAKNGNLYAAFLEQDVSQTYNTPETKLLRSTANIIGNEAVGAGDLRGVTYTFDEIFSGISGNVATVLELNTTQNNSAAFDLSGDCAFTVNGEFTIN